MAASTTYYGSPSDFQAEAELKSYIECVKIFLKVNRIPEDDQVAILFCGEDILCSPS